MNDGLVLSDGDRLLLELATMQCADGTRERLYREHLGLSWVQASARLLRLVYDPVAIVAEPRRTRVLAAALERQLGQKRAS